MRIISYNVNGIRAAINKGFIDWIRTDPADVICLQETKAEKNNIDCKAVNELGYEDYWYSAGKKGYSGVAVFTRIKPDRVQYGNNNRVSDDEGRVLQLDFGDTRLINAYFPSFIPFTNFWEALTPPRIMMRFRIAIAKAVNESAGEKRIQPGTFFWKKTR